MEGPFPYRTSRERERETEVTSPYSQHWLENVFSGGQINCCVQADMGDLND